MGLLREVLVYVFCMTFGDDDDDEFYPVARQTKAAVRSHQPARAHGVKQPDSLRKHCGISYIAESKKEVSFDRSMTIASDVITKQPDRSVCDENQNNNSLDNYTYIDHLEELIPSTGPILSSRTSRSNYQLFNNILDAVNTQQSANTHHPEVNTHEAVVDTLKPMQTRQQTRLKRKRKMSPEKKIAKKKQEYFLTPLHYGRYGEIMQRGPNGKAKYTDVASVINQGTIAHKNINTFTASKHNCLATLEPSKLWGTQKHLYFVKPILVGTVHLQDLMYKAGKRHLFEESEARFLCGNLFLAANFLHDHGIIHGSITPAKIVFNDNGYALLGYFGTAEGVRQRHSRPRETLPIDYTSPEQLRTKLYATTDVFAIAVITYEMIFGRVPHQGESYSKTRRNIENLEFVPEFERDKLSSPGRKFLKRCLRGRYEDRFNLLYQKKQVFDSIRWFRDIDENLMFMQEIVSPLKMMVQQLKGRWKLEPTPGTSSDPY